MGYMHIENLYKYTKFLKLFDEIYALEKIHGTSARIVFKDGKLHFHPGGSDYKDFLGCFDIDDIISKFNSSYSSQEITIYGEAYGGKIMGMSHTYGDKIRFIAFDVKINDVFQNVDDAHNICQQLNLEFVHYVKGSNTISFLNEQRDAPSIQAKRNGIKEDKIREGVVIRPLNESVIDGQRAIFKHKRVEFCETKTYRELGDELKIQTQINNIVDDWVTNTRLEHVIDKVKKEKDKNDNNISKKDTKYIIDLMCEDVMREGNKEIMWSKELERAIRKRTGKMLNN